MLGKQGDDLLVVLGAQFQAVAGFNHICFVSFADFGGQITGVVLGHLVAVSDGLLPLLGFGERLFPELEVPFIKTPDKSGQPMPPVSALKEKFQRVTAELAAHFQACTADEWLSRHMSVSPEDFIKEPHRNKLNVVISRTNHMANHLGQMLLLK